MPPKIRDLIGQLEKSGFHNRGGKGSHRNFSHETGAKITISGKAGDDAKIYQVKAVKLAIESTSK